MDHTITSHSKILLFFITMTISLLLISQSTTAQIPACGSNTTTFGNNSQFQANLNTLLGYLSSNATNPNGYHQAVSSDDNSRNNEIIYGHFLCRGDLNTSACQDCVTTATNELPTKYCANRKDALIWYEQCLLRYSNQSFFSKYDGSPIVMAWDINQIVGNASRFQELLGNMMNNEIAVQAAMGGLQKKFATNLANYTTFQTIYGLGQCTPDLSGSDCNICLSNGISQFNISQQGGRVLQPSCEVRYELYDLYPFFNLSSLPLPPQPSPQPPQQAPTNPTNSNGISTRLILAIVIPLATSLLGVLVIGICFFKSKKSKTYDAVDETSEDFINVESLQYDLAMLQSATNNFSTENKLGEGGFGGVYKGILENGQEIAVKRLSSNSRQGNAEFKNEVALVAKLRHKNLVTLLGFCVSSEEKILVYEFLAKSSLDRFLNDQTLRQTSLNWQTRFKIIVGIARGLLYLHEDSPFKIIHRDLKSSNILLDDDMNPKIADFGLAKLFGVDQTQGDTKRIVGTYGYMAPEYAITGHYSVRSDVYSFGVIILEMVSGQMNRFFGRLQLEEALLHRAWRLWNEGESIALVDKSLNDEEFSREEVSKCIHIGLLCIQEDATLRPRMTSIVAVLNGQANNFPMPKPPNFFGINVDDNDIQHNSDGIYRGSITITDLYLRD